MSTTKTRLASRTFALALAALAPSTGPLAAAERFVPTDIDWAHPVYKSGFETPEALRDWTLEGGKRMAVEDRSLVLENDARGDTEPTTNGNHLVAWLKAEVPADFLLEFAFRPMDRKRGLAIAFFNARGKKGESIFDKNLAARSGLFRGYHSGDIDNYHVSYWAGDRGTANLRKNRGFHLVEEGMDLVASASAGSWQKVRIYKRGGMIRLTVDDELALAWNDDGKTHGPVHDFAGRIGLRQMSHTQSARYRQLAVYPLTPATTPVRTEARERKVKVVDFETGNYSQTTNLEPCGDKVAGCDCAEGVSIKVVSKDAGHPVRAGNHSSYHRLKDCHERAEVVAGTAGFDAEAWIGFSIYLPDNPQSREYDHILMQFHDRYGGLKSQPKYAPGFKRGGPSLINVSGGEDGDIKLHIRYLDGELIKTTSIPFGKKTAMYGKWTDFVVNAKFVNDPSGFYKIWMYEAGSKTVGGDPGKPSLTYSGSTYHAFNNGGPAVRTGPYTGSPGKSPDPEFVMYSDEIRFGAAGGGVGFWDVAPNGEFTLSR